MTVKLNAEQKARIAEIRAQYSKCSKCGRDTLKKELQNGRCYKCAKKTLMICSYEGLRRWAEKKIGDAYNLWVMEDALREVEEAFKEYSRMHCKGVEVEP